ncbi:MAG: hypothetical protein R3B06_31880 [Kofleriaceae bacterium]
MTSPAVAAAAAGQAAYDRGYQLAMAGDYQQALAEFQRATELAPALAVAWFDRAGLTEQLGDPAAARALMRRCVEVEPRFIQARIELATLLDDPAAAIVELRLALTEPAPFVIERYPAARTRGEGLHKLAAIYGQLDFVAATAAIERSSAADPAAVVDDRAARVAAVAERSIADAQARDPALAPALAALANDVTVATTTATAAAALPRHLPLGDRLAGASASDQWRVWRGLATLQLRTDHLAAAALSFGRARTAARQLPLELWLDASFALTVLQVRLGQLDAAWRTFDELAWIEYAAAHADAPVGGQRRTRLISANPVMAPLRARADFAPTLARLGL